MKMSSSKPTILGQFEIYQTINPMCKFKYFSFLLQIEKHVCAFIPDGLYVDVILVAVQHGVLFFFSEKNFQDLFVFLGLVSFRRNFVPYFQS